jgi:predicted  nucleic acid-binding Zn-ribbon protein
MKNFQCKKCGTLVQLGNQPNSSGCPEGSLHQWQNLGDTGEKTYQCRKCGTVVHSGGQPNSSGCPKGSLHQWTKM